jgi:hypothetical protein
MAKFLVLTRQTLYMAKVVEGQSEIDARHTTELSHSAAKEASVMQGVTLDMDILSISKLVDDNPAPKIVVPKISIAKG